MKYLFWNTNKKKVNYILLELIVHFSCDVIALAEYNDDIEELMSMICNKGIRLYSVPKIACERLVIITKYHYEKIETFQEESHYTIKCMPHDTLGTQIIAFVHLQSKMYANMHDNINELQTVRKAIEDTERIVNSKKSIIVGDFNINPFEESMVSAIGMHSLSCRKVVFRNKIRRIQNKQHYTFYNPMWNMLGDMDSPSGTYYYSKGSTLKYFWNTFDQVIIRPELIENFKLDKLKIIDCVGTIKLLDNNGIPSVSDHLPIYFEIC
ncbi:MAG: hypothetical protein RR898_06865 [Clostridium sp.]|uniref:hypothetical protein n=1 Tax=Clostridium sp. TaxID=1506 RepID=UPI002FC77D96